MRPAVVARAFHPHRQIFRRRRRSGVIVEVAQKAADQLAAVVAKQAAENAADFPRRGLAVVRIRVVVKRALECAAPAVEDLFLPVVVGVKQGRYRAAETSGGVGASVAYPTGKGKFMFVGRLDFIQQSADRAVGEVNGEFADEVNAIPMRVESAARSVLGDPRCDIVVRPSGRRRRDGVVGENAVSVAGVIAGGVVIERTLCDSILIFVDCVENPLGQSGI